MIVFALAFLAGDVLIQQFSTLPTIMQTVGVLLSVLLVSLICYRRLSMLLMLAGFVCGFVWSDWRAEQLLRFHFRNEMLARVVTVNGYVASLPVYNNRQASFDLSVTSIELEGRKFSPEILVRLSWRNADPSIRVGDQRKFRVKLKAIHASQNPGTFDMEAWALQHGLRATGSVMSGSLSARHPFYFPLASLQEYIYERLKKLLPPSSTSHWLIALMLGIREGVPAADWNILRLTGTNHLMAIAGLHIGIIAGVVRSLISFLWRQAPKLMLMMPAQSAGAWASLGAALLYAVLAGFPIPAQRAFIMLMAFIFSSRFRFGLNAWAAWSLGMCIVLIINPLVVLSESFWLSFGTIAWIIFGMHGRLKPSGWWWHLGRVQWVIGLGLVPLSLWFYQEASLVSFIVNCIAIPWLAFLIMPFCFSACLTVLLSAPCAKLLLVCADAGLSGLWWLLEWFSHVPMAAWHHAMPSLPVFILTIGGCILLLLPAGFPGRWFGLIWLLPLCLLRSPLPGAGEVWLTVLDVGQGLSVIVQTSTHTLIYDAGPALNDKFNTGESTVLPVLRLKGVSTIDRLVVSHGDNDHLGGVSAILKSMPVKSIMTSVPDMIRGTAADECLAGFGWRWDGVAFQFLYPDQANLRLGNDSSCVLQIDNGSYRILLPGDIEKNAEQQLWLSQHNQLKSDVLVAPHHGSKTSGLAMFVESVHPRYIVYSTGYRNRYQFPHESVVQAYRNIHTVQLNTVDHGMLVFKVGKSAIAPVLSYRQIHHRYWYD